MNVRLLRRIQRQLLKEPDSYDQEVYVDTHTTDAGVCHTRACIAGWACLLSGRTVNGVLPRILLGLTLEQADRLFSPIEGPRGFRCLSTAWPERYARQYLEAKTPRGKARAGFRRIEHFIRTKGDD
jgi:hypothetical protein